MPNESSAIVRFVQGVQAEPIRRTQRAATDAVPAEVMEERVHRTSLLRYLLIGCLAVGLGGVAFYFAEKGGGGPPASAGGLAGALGGSSDREPSVIALPSNQRGEPERPLPAATAESPAEARPVSVEAAPVETAPEAAPVETARVEMITTPPPFGAISEEPREARRPRLTAKKRARRAKKHSRRAKVATSGAHGTLMVGAKPPCRIYIDGRDTKLTTPQRSIELSEGRHKVVLLNGEYGIRSRTTVVVKAGKTVRIIKDLTDRIHQ